MNELLTQLPNDPRVIGYFCGQGWHDAKIKGLLGEGGEAIAKRLLTYVLSSTEPAQLAEEKTAEGG